ASLPRTGDNALLKLAPVLEALRDRQPSYDLVEAPAALLQGLGEDPSDPATAVAHIGDEEPGLLTLLEPMLGVTLTPTMVHASDKINVIPSRASVKVDCRVPPGLGEDAARRRIEEVLGDVEIEFTERVTGNSSPVDSPLTDAI